ncbi:MAG TPA: SpoIIE family protein phosphatase [Terriglobia bacterium]|nr:SpoIIE family protein phosphatase [Terriglobia bacterium]
MARFAVWVAAYGAALWVVGRTTGTVPGGLWLLFWITFVPTAFYYLYRMVKLFKQKLLWRLRRRLAVTYVFIAVVPIFLILFLVALGTWLVNSQFASYLVASKLRDRAAVLRHLDRVIVHEADHLRLKTPEAMLDELQNFFTSDFREHAANYPGLTLTLRLGSLVRTSSLDPNLQPQPVTIPAWIKDEDFSAIVVDEGKLALRAVDRQQTNKGELIVVLSQPFTPDLLDQVGEGIGPITLLTPHQLNPAAGSQPAQSGPRAQGSGSKSPNLIFDTDHGRVTEETSIQSKSIAVPAPANRFDYIVYNWATLDPILWGGDAQAERPEAGVFLVTSRYITLDRQLLSTLGQYSGLYWSAFAVVGIVFLIIELVAMVIGFQLTRSMTTTVDKLHEGTKRVQVGDFSYRIGLPARDQLSALGEAFDGMTSSVERLLRESLEKTRLEGELEIAREVQSQLFPQVVPEVPGLQLYGVCKPARMVSGDYYDFLRLGDDRVGLVVGDISGKGISAALLMASIQSALHAQFYDEHEPGILSEKALMSSAGVVGRLNRQLYASTPTEKYATFFYAIYDGATRQLTFTNAGHPPPFYFHRGKIERLETGGTVVGLFGPATYEQAVIQLEPGDMLMAFTDGMTEPENSFGEEFGEDRLLEAAQRASACPPEEMVKEIYRTINDWTGSPELQDDMTLVVARAID